MSQIDPFETLAPPIEAPSSGVANITSDGSLSLAEYPAAMVRLTCSKCGRSGQYRKAALIETYGAEIPLPDLLHKIGANCPKMDAVGNDPCGAHYRDL